MAVDRSGFQVLEFNSKSTRVENCGSTLPLSSIGVESEPLAVKDTAWKIHGHHDDAP